MAKKPFDKAFLDILEKALNTRHRQKISEKYKKTLKIGTSPILSHPEEYFQSLLYHKINLCGPLLPPLSLFDFFPIFCYNRKLTVPYQPSTISAHLRRKDIMKSTPFWRSYEAKWGIVAMVGLAIFFIAILVRYTPDLAPTTKDIAQTIIFIGGAIVFLGVIKMYYPPRGLYEDSDT